MIVQMLVFYLLSAVAVGAGVMVISARNPVHSVLFLILAFFNSAGLFVLVGAEFLAMVLVIVYVGAVAVLFLFVVMMLDINIGKLREGFWGYFPLAATIGVVIVLEMSAVLLRGFWAIDSQAPAAAATIGNTRELGKLIYTQYVYAFEIAAVILLVAIIAAVALTLRRRKDSKYFDPADAVKVKASDRLRIVSMKAESARAQGITGNGQLAAVAATDPTQGKAQ